MMFKERKNYGKHNIIYIHLQFRSKLRKKINAKLYPMRLILILKHFPFTPEILDKNFNAIPFIMF